MLHHRPTFLLAAMSSVALFALAGCSDAMTGDPGSASAAGSVADGGYSKGDAAEQAPSSDGGAVSAQCLTSNFAVCSDFQIIAIASALNETEINLANVVLSKGASGQAAAFASEMVTDHTMLLNSLTQVSSTQGLSPAEGAISLEIRTMGQLDVTRFSSLTSTTLDEEYISHEILVHTEALGLIRWMLIPSAQNPTLMSALQVAQSMVEQHLALALQTQTALLGGACGGTATVVPADAGCPTDAGTMQDGGNSY